MATKVLPMRNAAATNGDGPPIIDLEVDVDQLTINDLATLDEMAAIGDGERLKPGQLRDLVALLNRATGGKAGLFKMSQMQAVAKQVAEAIGEAGNPTTPLER